MTTDMTSNLQPQAAPAVEKYTVENGPMTTELRSAGKGLKDLGGGILRFDNGGTGEPWKLPYEELLYVISGTLRLKFDGQVLTAVPGDVITIPRGSEVVYEGDPGTTAFYALAPSTWYREHPNGL